jgi:hypothetical protein
MWPFAITFHHHHHHRHQKNGDKSPCDLVAIKKHLKQDIMPFSGDLDLIGSCEDHLQRSIYNLNTILTN